MMDLSKQLAETNERWNNQNDEIDGINQDLAAIGWAAMDGDSDFEEEEQDQRQLDHQLWAGQEGHYQEFAMRQAKGKGKQAKGADWMEGDGEDAGMGDNQHAQGQGVG
eukprot:14369121-Heterocapsa_arctica.AAC.1